jgi:hypothetical protein
MTLVLSLIHPDAVIMAADSRKTEHLTPVNVETLEPIGETRVEWSETTKLFVIRGIGCVSMWGDITRAEKKIGGYLHAKAEQLAGPSDLADSLLYFLKEEIHAEDGDDIGFHIGGYMPDGSKALYHVFWGGDIGPEVDPNNNPRKFAKYNHSETEVALYNGKHFIADGIIRFLLALQQEVGIVSWITSHPPEIAVRFADFVIRYAARIDSTVGGTAKVAMILPGNRVILITNPTSKPIPFIDVVVPAKSKGAG